MYDFRSNLMIGFHGCSETSRDNLVNNPKEIKISEKKYDWLGHGFYVWENNYERAKQWAEDRVKRKKSGIPSVIGVVYTLDNCLDFSDSKYIDLIADVYDVYKNEKETNREILPKNTNTLIDNYNDKLFRELDCAVIQYLHSEIEINKNNNTNYSGLQPFDTVRGIFQEGGPAFEGSGIRKKSHIQVCIRNLDCIKGFFIPRN